MISNLYRAWCSVFLELTDLSVANQAVLHNLDEDMTLERNDNILHMYRYFIAQILYLAR